MKNIKNIVVNYLKQNYTIKKVNWQKTNKYKKLYFDIALLEGDKQIITVLADDLKPTNKKDKNDYDAHLENIVTVMYAILIAVKTKQISNKQAGKYTKNFIRDLNFLNVLLDYEDGVAANILPDVDYELADI